MYDEQDTKMLQVGNELQGVDWKLVIIEVKIV